MDMTLPSFMQGCSRQSLWLGRPAKPPAVHPPLSSRLMPEAESGCLSAAHGSAVSAAVLASAGQAVAATVVPDGTGIPTAGSAPAVDASAVDSAVNQLIEAVRVGCRCTRASCAPKSLSCMIGTSVFPRMPCRQQIRRSFRRRWGAGNT